jgi:hypothetical protein
MFAVCGGKSLSHKAVTNISLMMQRLEQKCGSDRDNSQKTSMLRVLLHWQSDGTSVSMLVEDMSRNKCFFHVGILHVLYPFVTYLLTLTSSMNIDVHLKHP